jgi:Ca2+-binding EF-hand superfamily protein
MKLSPLLIALLVGFVASNAFAAETEHAALFARLDANTDDQLTKLEIPAEHAALFRRLVRIGDEDGDGKLSLSEFEASLTNNRPEKAITEKIPNKLPGADALLLMLTWMDRNADLSITENEVPAKLKPLYDQFAGLMNLPDSSRLPVPQLRQQSGRYGVMAQRFANRQRIDVEVELALLTDAQWQYVERLREPLRPGNLPRNRQGVRQLLNRADSDGDGKMSREEAPPRLTNRFDTLDQNGDNQLSGEELSAAVETLAALRNSTGKRFQQSPPSDGGTKKPGEK